MLAKDSYFSANSAKIKLTDPKTKRDFKCIYRFKHALKTSSGNQDLK